ncbi:hypothetical protein M3Y97_00250900 [Aphelenchoides bicaudatus]|nr:hypothetical protein M3Y97_00250900 [Aphelenchoides bicaudatus]
MTSSHKDKSHHSSLFSVFQRKKRQTSAPIAPHNQQPPQLYNEHATSSRENIENQPIDSSKASLPPSGFVQRFKLHKRSRNTDQKQDDKFLNGPLKSSQSQTLTKPPAKHKNKRDQSANKRNKSFSTDAINELDPDFLIEALLAIGDDQPTVARSIPKHSVVVNNPKKVEERQRNNCIFEPAIYERMLDDSLLVCDLLKEHLNDCVKTVRAQSPLVAKKGAIQTNSFQEFLITATAPSTPSRSPATQYRSEHRSPLTISSASMSPLLLSSSPSPSFYRQKSNEQENGTKKDLIPVR